MLRRPFLTLVATLSMAAPAAPAVAQSSAPAEVSRWEKLVRYSGAKPE